MLEWEPEVHTLSNFSFITAKEDCRRMCLKACADNGMGNGGCDKKRCHCFHDKGNTYIHLINR